MGLANGIGASRVPILCLNAVYPLVPEQITQFCAGKRAVLALEEGQPEYIEQELNTILRRADLQTPLHGKDMLAMAGEYSTELITTGLLNFLRKLGICFNEVNAGDAQLRALADVRTRAADALVALELATAHLPEFRAVVTQLHVRATRR